MNTTNNPLEKSYTEPINWESLSSDQKIERMREIVKVNISALSKAQVQIHNLRLKLKNHYHKDDKVYELKEMKDYDESTGLVGAASTDNSNNFF